VPHRVKTIGFSFEDLTGQPGVALHTFEQRVSDSKLLCQPEVGFYEFTGTARISEEDMNPSLNLKKSAKSLAAFG
jgi:hypothetical protein